MIHSLPGFSDMLAEIEKKFSIAIGWVPYFGEGVDEHKWHCDKDYRGSHWMKILLSGDRKVMHFQSKSRDTEMTRSIPHCAVVILTRKGGGVDSDIQHTVVNCENSWSIIFELKHLPLSEINHNCNK